MVVGKEDGINMSEFVGEIFKDVLGVLEPLHREEEWNGGCVVVDDWIHQDLLSLEAKEKRGMTEPGKGWCFRFHLGVFDGLNRDAGMPDIG